MSEELVKELVDKLNTLKTQAISQADSRRVELEKELEKAKDEVKKLEQALEASKRPARAGDKFPFCPYSEWDADEWYCEADPDRWKCDGYVVQPNGLFPCGLYGPKMWMDFSIKKQLDEVIRKVKELQRELERAPRFMRAGGVENAFDVIHEFLTSKDYVRISGKDGEIVREIFEFRSGLYTNYPDEIVLYERKNGGFVVQRDEFDDWRTYTYVPREEYENILRQRAEDEVNNPKSSLIETILGISDYSSCYECEHYKIIMGDVLLKARAIEAFKEKLIKYADEGKIPFFVGVSKSIQTKFGSVRVTIPHDCGIKVLERLGVNVEEYIKKLENAAIKKAEEEARRREEEVRKEAERVKEVTKKVKAIHPKLEVIKTFSSYVEVKINYIKDRKEFDDLVAKLKSLGGKFNYQSKTWTIKIP